MFPNVPLLFLRRLNLQTRKRNLVTILILTPSHTFSYNDHQCRGIHSTAVTCDLPSVTERPWMHGCDGVPYTVSTGLECSRTVSAQGNVNTASHTFRALMYGEHVLEYSPLAMARVHKRSSTFLTQNTSSIHALLRPEGSTTAPEAAHTPSR